MISIVIPNYNGNKYLPKCLKSISRQTYKDYEVIIIDNASTDGSYEWIKDYPDIEFQVLEKNYGFSIAVNCGIQKAKGEYVLLLNNDTELFEDFLEKILRAIEKDNKVFAVSSKMIQYHHQDLIDDAGDEYTVVGWGHKRGDGAPIDTYMKPKRVFSACAGAALYRKEVFEQIGCFDEAFFAYLEDMDICYRANIFGYKNIYYPEAKVYHIGSATSGGKYSDFKIKLSGRNNIYVIYKNMPLLQLLINLPCLLVGYWIKQWVFKRRGYPTAFKEGTWEGLKTLKKVKKIPFKFRHIPYYLYIEWVLIRNIFVYMYELIKLDIITRNSK